MKTETMAAVHWTKAILRLLLIFVSLPVLLAGTKVKHLRYKAALIDSLEASGMPRESAKALADETGLRRMLTPDNT